MTHERRRCGGRAMTPPTWSSPYRSWLLWRIVHPFKDVHQRAKKQQWWFVALVAFEATMFATVGFHWLTATIVSVVLPAIYALNVSTERYARQADHWNAERERLIREYDVMKRVRDDAIMRSMFGQHADN